MSNPKHPKVFAGSGLARAKLRAFEALGQLYAEGFAELESHFKVLEDFRSEAAGRGAGWGWGGWGGGWVRESNGPTILGG